MAKAKDLAGLAALGALAYSMRNKGEAPKGKEDTGPGYKSIETREAPRRQITDYQTEAPMDPREAGSAVPSASSDVFSAKPAPIKSRSVVPSASKPAVTPSAEDITTEPVEPTDLKSSVTPAARSDQLANLSRAVKREAKTSKAAQGDFRGGTTVFTTSGKPNLEKQKLYDAVDEKSGSSDKSAYKTDALKVASRAVAEADRQRRIAGAGVMKKGGAVKKMASGGMTASKRADGIASRGKTKCKMY
jgi:hypothetical protein